MRNFAFVAAFALAAMTAAAPVPAAAQGMTATGSLENRVKRLEEKLDVLESKDEITRLIMEYGHTLDTADYVGYGNLFAKKGTWVGSTGKGPGPHVYTGPAEITAAMTESYKEPAHSFHVFTNVMLDVHGDTATGLTKWHFVVPGDEGEAVILHSGMYKDQFVREDGHWKFLNRGVTQAFPPPAAK